MFEYMNIWTDSVNGEWLRDVVAISYNINAAQQMWMRHANEPFQNIYYVPQSVT